MYAVVVGLGQQSHLNRIISTSCCINTVVPHDDGPRYTRNMQRLTKYTKNKLCMKLVFLYTITVLVATKVNFGGFNCRQTQLVYNLWK
jgi:hypothetical protein